MVQSNDSNETSEKPPQDTLGGRLLRAREAAGITPPQLARRLGVKTRTVQAWESDGSEPRANRLTMLSAFLGVSQTWLLTGVGQEHSEEQKRETETLIRTARDIPEQNPLIRFGVSDEIKLHLVPSFANENDYETIEALRSEMLAAKGPINSLMARYAQNPNTPQAGLFGPLTERYNVELSKDPREINYAVLYARGARFYAARNTAIRQMASGEWPELGADEEEAIDAVCSLHGPLIMASAVGRRLVVDAHEYETTPEVYREEEELLQQFGVALSSESEIIEAETADAIADLTVPIKDDPQPARSREARLILTGSALTAVVGGAAWYAAGGVVAAIVVPAALLGAAGVAGGFVWEVTKKTGRFKLATDDLAKRADREIDKAEKDVDRQQELLLERMATFVDRKRELFEKVANLRPEFGWARRYLRNGSGVDPSSQGHDAAAELTTENKEISVGISNLPGTVRIKSSDAAPGLSIFSADGWQRIESSSLSHLSDDRLFYSIVEGGKGFTINPINGEVCLARPTPTQGKHELTIQVSNENSPPYTERGKLEVVFY